MIGGLGVERKKQNAKSKKHKTKKQITKSAKQKTQSGTQKSKKRKVKSKNQKAKSRKHRGGTKSKKQEAPRGSKKQEAPWGSSHGQTGLSEATTRPPTSISRLGRVSADPPTSDILYARTHAKAIVKVYAEGTMPKAKEGSQKCMMWGFSKITQEVLFRNTKTGKLEFHSLKDVIEKNKCVAVWRGNEFPAGVPPKTVVIHFAQCCFQPHQALSLKHIFFFYHFFVFFPDRFVTVFVRTVCVTFFSRAHVFYNFELSSGACSNIRAIAVEVQ